LGEYVYNWECNGCCAGREIMKAFKVTGQIKKPQLATPFAKEIIAEKSEHAVEKVYAEIGSKHRVKRFQIKITDVKEMQGDEIKDPILKKLIIGEQ